MGRGGRRSPDDSQPDGGADAGRRATRCAGVRRSLAAAPNRALIVPTALPGSLRGHCVAPGKKETLRLRQGSLLRTFCTSCTNYMLSGPLPHPKNRVRAPCLATPAGKFQPANKVSRRPFRSRKFWTRRANDSLSACNRLKTKAERRAEAAHCISRHAFAESRSRSRSIPRQAYCRVKARA